MADDVVVLMLMEVAELIAVIVRGRTTRAGENFTGLVVDDDDKTRASFLFLFLVIEGPAGSGIDEAIMEDWLSDHGSGERNFAEIFSSKSELLELLLAARTYPNGGIFRVAMIDADAMTAIDRLPAAPMTDDFSRWRVFDDDLGSVAIDDEDVSIWKRCRVTRGERWFAFFDNASLLRAGEGPDNGAVLFKDGNHSFVTTWLSFAREMPGAVHVNEVLFAIDIYGFDAMTSFEPFTEGAHIGAVWFKYDDGIIWMIGDEVEKAIFPCDHSVGIDDRSVLSFDFRPAAVHAIFVIVLADDFMGVELLFGERFRGVLSKCRTGAK